MKRRTENVAAKFYKKTKFNLRCHYEGVPLVPTTVRDGNPPGINEVIQSMPGDNGGVC